MSSSATTSQAIALTGVPDDDAMIIVARRTPANSEPDRRHQPPTPRTSTH
ncbi:hypothetical protein [Cryptosporangium phraense]|nr:hypothetical protein [Cryptosporangium phraense]